jgi:hypothetical protein
LNLIRVMPAKGQDRNSLHQPVRIVRRAQAAGHFRVDGRQRQTPTPNEPIEMNLGATP